MCLYQNMPSREIKDFFYGPLAPQICFCLLLRWLTIIEWMVEVVVVHVEIKYCHFTTHVACAADGREGDVEEFCHLLLLNGFQTVCEQK